MSQMDRSLLRECSLRLCTRPGVWSGREAWSMLSAHHVLPTGAFVLALGFTAGAIPAGRVANSRDTEMTVRAEPNDA